MLVLSRKVGQRLVIGDGVTVVIKRIAGQRVTLGIEAPQTVKIIRGELPVFEVLAGDLGGNDLSSADARMPALPAIPR